MKVLYKIVLLILYFFSYTQSQWRPCPDTTFFAFDIDDVLVESSMFHKFNLVVGGILYQPLNSYNWIMSLLQIKNSYKKDANGHREDLYDEDGNAINGLTFHFLYHGMRDKNIAPYVPWIINILEYSRTPIAGTVEICNYLKKEKGYMIVFATNKDRISYDAFAQTSGKSITHLPEKVFVAQPGNHPNLIKKIRDFAKQDQVPTNYKQLLYKTITVQPTEHIRHVPSTKPQATYYEYVHKTMKKENNKKNMIFIDDKQNNIDGVREYGKQVADNSNVAGITFKNPHQLVQALIQLNILSTTYDKEFISKMDKYK